LVNAIDWAIANARDHDVLFPMHLPVDIRVSIKRQAIRKNGSDTVPEADPIAEPSDLPKWKAYLEEMERRYYNSLVTRTNGDVKMACRISGLSRSVLYSRLKKYSIERPE
jgi:two-component system NtrC family response regulator